MATRDAKRAGGSLMDIARLSSLPDDDCYVLLVSSRTLYLLANYADNEVNYLGRYIKEFLPGGLVDTVEAGDPEEELVLEIANQFGLEVIPVCEELFDALSQISAQLGLINGSIQVAASVDGCCTPYGAPVPDPAATEGDPDVDPPPTGFDTWDEYFTYKCKAANKIADDWIGTIDNLQTLGGVLGAISAIALAAFLNTSLLGGLLVGVMALGFSAGTAAAIVIGLLVALVAGGVGLFAYFADLSADMETDKADLVCDLFFSKSPQAAKNIVLQYTSDKALGLTYDPGDDDALFQATANGMADALFNEAVLNTLFEYDSDNDAYVGDVDCDTCINQSDWVLIPSGTYQGWTTASGTYGTGGIDQEGGQFTLNSSQITSGPFTGQHILGIAVQAFLDSQAGDPDLLTSPSGAVNGQITLVSGSQTTLRVGRKCTNPTNCLTFDSATPTTRPVTEIGQMFVFWRTSGANSITMTIDETPDTCTP